MCFAYFRMNQYEKNPLKYIEQKCEFLLMRGYSLHYWSRNAEKFFSFNVENPDFESHIYLYSENDTVNCSFAKKSREMDITTLGIKLPADFYEWTNIEKIDFYIECIRAKIDELDMRSNAI